MEACNGSLQHTSLHGPPLPCALQPFLALGQTNLCMECFTTFSSDLVCFSRQATRHILGVTSCPPPTWRYGPRKSML